MAPPLFPLWAVHISDGVLSPAWLGAGFGGAGLLVALGSWRIRDEEIPQIALLTAAFFVASLIHVAAPPTSVHLLLTGLVGVILGRRAGLAILVGLFLQYVLIQHGGFYTLGINCCVMALPALLSWQLFIGLRKVMRAGSTWIREGLIALAAMIWTLSLTYAVVLLLSNRSTSFATLSLEQANQVTFHPLTLACCLLLSLVLAWAERRLKHPPEFALGLLVGEFAVLLTVFLNGLVLVAGGQEDWPSLLLFILIPHLFLAVIEGVILGFTVSFLARETGTASRPGCGARAMRGFRPMNKPSILQSGDWSTKDARGLLVKLALAGFVLFAATGSAQAHKLVVEFKVFPARKIRVAAWYDSLSKPVPARNAKVAIATQDGKPVAEGKLDALGHFTFTFEKKEPLKVVAYQTGHREEITIPLDAFDNLSEEELPDGTLDRPHEQNQPMIVNAKNNAAEIFVVLVGVSFLLSLAAFILSLKNARRLKELEKKTNPGDPKSQ